MLALDNIRGFLIQLACAGGSGAIAKTAVAPLERVKVSCSSRFGKEVWWDNRSTAPVLPVLPGNNSGRMQAASQQQQQTATQLQQKHLKPPAQVACIDPRPCQTNNHCHMPPAHLANFPAPDQILLQVQQMSSIPKHQQYKGLFDALRRIPHREGGIQVRPACIASNPPTHTGPAQHTTSIEQLCVWG